MSDQLASDQPEIILTAKDFALLQSLLHEYGEPFAGAAEIIRHKLSVAQVMFPADIPANVVTLNSRVRFRVGTAPTQDRSLVAGPSEEVYGLTVLLTVPRGLALLGAKAGQTVQARRRDGSVENLVIEAVLFQPERRRSSPPLQVVARNEATPSPLAPRSPSSRFVPAGLGGGDDPGPSAA
ncbi:nucleoside-diphosphate kinase [Devosia sp. 1566]|uniref:nucleoside-diphosphate kinase n=1 Tax=Devosia sp. 1566 TaxID=2499144 RepID=UPI000FDA3B89|nr:nucleoside-diphosphate kinase [Devosia sp. 1566]